MMDDDLLREATQRFSEMTVAGVYEEVIRSKVNRKSVEMTASEKVTLMFGGKAKAVLGLRGDQGSGGDRGTAGQEDKVLDDAVKEASQMENK